MNVELFETLGKYAGLAGISLGLVLVVFNTLLKLNIFPKPKTDQAYNLLKQLIYLTFTIGIVGIIAWASINRKEAATNAINGKVTDASTKAVIVDAEITVSQRTETARTDSVGFFNLPFASPPPTGSFLLYISKEGYETYRRYVTVGQSLEAEIVHTAPIAQVQTPPPPQFTTTPEVYSTDDVASGACKDFGAWATICTPDKPQGWSIIDQHFDLTGDRAGCAYARCEPLGTISATKACYRFQSQGHDEGCGHSGNTGIHYPKGVLCSAPS
jgi:hypothetical protein